MEPKPKQTEEKQPQKENDDIILITSQDNSNLKTKKKSFISEVDPHLIKRKIQKERYIWFGVYNELLRNKNIIKILSKCKDQSIPIESAAIHLEKYKLAFNCNRTFITFNEESAIFIKLYLITKDQLFDILKTYYNCPEHIIKDQQSIIKSLIKPESEYSLKDINSNLNTTPIMNSDSNTNQYYDILKCVGELDSISILTATSSHHEIAAPEPEYLRTIYIGLKKSFQPYSEFLIMYYVYLLDGVKNFYTIKQLQEVFLNPKVPTEHSSASSETNMTIEQANNKQRFLGYPQQNTLDNLNTNTPSPHIKKDNETVKCSTCNASPFVGTPEKDQLNQYSYIFDLHHLPIFDENTGEFFWSNNEANWKTARDSIIKSEEINGKSMSINHGSLVSLSNSFCNNVMNSANKKDEIDNKNTEGKWLNFKNENNSGTFIEELNNLLKEIN